MGHIEVVHKKVRYPCNLCGKKFTTKGFLKIHIASVHENVTHECNQCGKHFTIKGNLAKHIQSVHQMVKYNCNHCEKQFTANGDLKIHQSMKKLSSLVLCVNLKPPERGFCSLISEKCICLIISFVINNK